jgi:hypothetical protein
VKIKKREYTRKSKDEVYLKHGTEKEASRKKYRRNQSQKHQPEETKCSDIVNR